LPNTKFADSRNAGVHTRESSGDYKRALATIEVGKLKETFMAFGLDDSFNQPVTKADFLALQKQIMESSQEINKTLERIAISLEKQTGTIPR
jgi:hypothetical protein